MDTMVENISREDIIFDIISKNEKQIEIENNVKQELVNLFDGKLTLDEINKRLLKNSFKGIYIIDDDIFNKLIEKDSILAFYSNLHKAIFISKNNYEKYEYTLSHEMIHALIDHEIKIVNRDCNCKDEFNNIGLGIEEGIASCVSLAIENGKKTFDDSNYLSYPNQVKLIQQLNVLYSYSNCKKYSSIILHAIKEPKTFLSLIKDIYLSILDKRFCIDKNLINVAYKTAYDFVSICNDLEEYSMNIIEDNKNSILLVFAISYININYLYLIDKTIFDNELNENIKKIFLLDKGVCLKNFKNEELLLKSIFGDSILYNSILKEVEDCSGFVPNYIEQEEIPFITVKKKTCK